LRPPSECVNISTPSLHKRRQINYSRFGNQDINSVQSEILQPSRLAPDRMKFSVLLLALVICVLSQDDCRFTSPRSTQCTSFATERCPAGRIVWPYPISTCRFVVNYTPIGSGDVELIAAPAPLSWKVYDKSGTLVREGVRSLNKHHCHCRGWISS
jgi:hypothetical protein